MGLKRKKGKADTSPNHQKNKREGRLNEDRGGAHECPSQKHHTKKSGLTKGK